MGYGMLYWQDWRKLKGQREFQRKIFSDSVDSSGDSLKKRWSSIDLSAIHELNKLEIQKLLSRVQSEGVDSLSREEKAFLNRFSTD